jgi:glutathione synthase/RimK-type ligase-like ATP-grasp enzyme
MKFLISTEPNDIHTIVVKLALEEMGHQVRLLFKADLPTSQTNSVYFDNVSDCHWTFSDELDTRVDNNFDVVWWRRTPKPYVPKTLIHADDYRFVLSENLSFDDGLTNSIAADAWWVNSKEAANKADSKLLQIRIAKECGMKIRITLFSNAPNDIRNFILKHEKIGVIYKPFCSNFWLEENKTRVSYTSQISIDRLASDKLLQLSPGIYQNKIAKKHEIRVICFGDYLVAVKLNSQCHSENNLDWREITPSKMVTEHCTLPAKLEHQVRSFMHRMGIVFGSFDFIVTPDDDYVFLEVNEQGQFLWIEEFNPEFNLLDIFVSFLVNKSVKFSWSAHKDQHTVTQYKSRVSKEVDINMKYHVKSDSGNYTAGSITKSK